MIKVFTELTTQIGSAAGLSGGIAEALITTAAGLTVAIPALMMHRYFTRRVDTLVLRMEQEALRLVDALQSGRVVEREGTVCGELKRSERRTVGQHELSAPLQ